MKIQTNFDTHTSRSQSNPNVPHDDFWLHVLYAFWFRLTLLLFKNIWINHNFYFYSLFFLFIHYPIVLFAFDLFEVFVSDSASLFYNMHLTKCFIWLFVCLLVLCLLYLVFFWHFTIKSQSTIDVKRGYKHIFFAFLPSKISCIQFQKWSSFFSSSFLSLKWNFIFWIQEVIKKFRGLLFCNPETLKFSQTTMTKSMSSNIFNQLSHALD